jgi:hypothetical protein
MQTKLTLRMNSALIEQAKQYAQEHDVSLSQLVAEYFAVLTAQDNDKAAFEATLPPITRSLVGILKESVYDPEAYKDYLAEKYA